MLVSVRLGQIRLGRLGFSRRTVLRRKILEPNYGHVITPPPRKWWQYRVEELQLGPNELSRVASLSWGPELFVNLLSERLTSLGKCWNGGHEWVKGVLSESWMHVNEMYWLSFHQNYFILRKNHDECFNLLLRKFSAVSKKINFLRNQEVY